MCDVRLNEICRLMIAQEARIRGRSACFENDQEVCTVLPMLYNIDLPMMLKISSGDLDADGKPIMQMIMPAKATPILIKSNDELLPPIIATLGQPIINPVIIAAPGLPTPLLLPTTTTTTTPAATTEINTTTSTTTTTTTTSTTPPPATITTTTQIPAMEMVTTTGPTTTTTTTTTPQPNDTLVLDIEEPHLRPNETQENLGNAIPNKTSSDVAQLPLPVGEHETTQPVQMHQTPLVDGEQRVVEHVDETVAKTEYETVEYIPNVVLAPPATPPLSKTNLLEEDSQDSQSNSVLPGDLEHASQDLQIPEQPPEE